jgi:hypothetical protein
MITDLGERFLLCREHPLFLREDPQRGEVRAYQRVRDGMTALVHRNVFYRMAEMAGSTARAGRRGCTATGSSSRWSEAVVCRRPGVLRAGPAAGSHIFG